ncbi:MAG: hypothetical protein FD135_2624 [Comamonadaceae bacterium]|nr:MAG: hypothetical protein FD135_2624 [Comamonadaceae bacterium]
MASVVDTSVKYIHSGMVGVPVFNGVPGSLVGLLNAFLITGFDFKSATSLTVASGVATLSFAGQHSAAVDTVILVDGSSIDALNGEQKVTAIGSGIVKFATAAPDGTATGAITFKMAAAGWTQPFTGTNVATYKSADPASTGMILRVNDTATTLARVVGYESMTDIDTGSGPFPTPVQVSGGGYWAKSSVANTNATSWVLFADGRKLIFHNAAYYSSNATYTSGVTRGFGDDIALRPGGDPYACSISYTAANVPYDYAGGLDGIYDTYQAMPRGYTGLGSCVIHTLRPYAGLASSQSGIDGYMGAFPSVVDGGLRLGRKFFSSATSNQPPRSDLPGLYHVPQTGVFDAFKTRDIITGTGSLAGRKLMALNPGTSIQSTPTAGSCGVSFVDITGPWR